MKSNPSDNPLISIIVPTYNAERSVEKCLNSILLQRFTGYEVVVQDGLSTDRTIELVDQMSVQFLPGAIRVFREKDKGVYDAMNKGIQNARGAWLFFLGSDDELYNDQVLEKVSAVLNDTDALFVYGNVKIIGEGTWAKDGQIYDGEFSVKKLFETNISHQAIFYHKSIFSKLGNFNYEYKICADWDFNHRCFASIKNQYINVIVANFFAGGLSTMHESDKYVTLDRVLNLKKYYSINYSNPLFKDHEWTFYGNAKKEFLSKHYIKAFQFVFYSFLHSRMKLGLFKTYIKDILRIGGRKFKLI